MKILVTGASGFIGGHLVKELKKSKAEVITTDRRGCVDIHTNLAVGENVKRLPDVDLVYHLAGISRVRDANDWEITHVHNVAVTQYLAERYGSSVVFASTYLGERTIYGETKALASSIVDKHGGTVCRIANVYGPGGHGVVDRWIEENVCGFTSEVYNLEVACDFVHVDDVVKGLINQDRYIGTSTPFKIDELVRLFDHEIVHCPIRHVIDPIIEQHGKANFKLFQYIKENLNVRN